MPELLAPEFSVRVIVRDPGRLPREIRQQVEIIRGSTDDAATLRRALDGVEASDMKTRPSSTTDILM